MSYRRNPDVAHMVVDGRAVLLDPAGAELITLSASGARVWELLDRPREVDELVSELSVAFPTAGEASVRHDVTAFVGDLADEGLLLRDG